MVAIEKGQDEQRFAPDEHSILGQIGWVSQAYRLTPPDVDRKRLDWTQLRAILSPLPFTALWATGIRVPS